MIRRRRYDNMPDREDEVEPNYPDVPGSVLLASIIERRIFLRKSATALLYSVAGAMVGSLATAKSALANPTSDTGPCCPSCCGPSPCCNTSCCNKPCCSQNSTSCADNGSTCLGRTIAITAVVRVAAGRACTVAQSPLGVTARQTTRRVAPTSPTGASVTTRIFIFPREGCGLIGPFSSHPPVQFAPGRFDTVLSAYPSLWLHDWAARLNLDLSF
jgi:hypothetical protein